MQMLQHYVQTNYSHPFSQYQLFLEPLLDSHRKKLLIQKMFHHLILSIYQYDQQHIQHKYLFLTKH